MKHTFPYSKNFLLFFVLVSTHFLLQTEGFRRGTLVATPQGYIPIEKLDIADEVLTYDIYTGKTEAASIHEISYEIVYEYLCITIGTTNLYVRQDQLLYIANKYGFRHAYTIDRNDYLLQSDGTMVHIDSFQYMQQKVEIYTLSVDYPNTLCVTSKNIIAHN
jgi:hypothetical protein